MSLISQFRRRDCLTDSVWPDQVAKRPENSSLRLPFALNLRRRDLGVLGSGAEERFWPKGLSRKECFAFCTSSISRHRICKVDATKFLNRIHFMISLFCFVGLGRVGKSSHQIFSANHPQTDFGSWSVWTPSVYNFVDLGVVSFLGDKRSFD